MTRPITERMADAKAKMIARKRVPRVFFLVAEDFAAFERTKPGTLEAMFAVPLGSKPQPLTCLGFDGLPVRPSQQRTGRRSSKLYCCAGTAVGIAQ
jgi:hypothetical protein